MSTSQDRNSLIPALPISPIVEEASLFAYLPPFGVATSTISINVRMSSEANSTTTVPKPSTDEVLRRVGRNLVLFQQIEYLLKYLTSKARIAAPAGQFLEQYAKLGARTQRKTMGDLAGQLARTVLQPEHEDKEASNEDEAWLSFKFSMHTDAESAVRHESDLRELIQRRNELVHHFLPRWAATTRGDAEPVLSWLDEQYTDGVAMLDQLQGWAHALDMALEGLRTTLDSEEGQQQLELMYLRCCPLVRMLGQVALATPREDGWTLLSTAGALIRRQAPEELDDLKGRFGVDTLQAVLLASECFDIAQEPTPGTGTRTIYRTNARWHLDSSPTDCHIKD